MNDNRICNKNTVYSQFWAGFVGMRADLCLGDYDLIIEAKCVRKSMTEWSLNDEISSDGWNYQADNLYLFVYDKEHIMIMSPKVGKSRLR